MIKKRKKKKKRKNPFSKISDFIFCHCVRNYVHLYTYVCVHVYVCMRTCVRKYMRLRMYVCMYVCVYKCIEYFFVLKEFIYILIYFYFHMGGDCLMFNKYK